MKNEPVRIYNRCQSWGPGRLLKCEGVKGHEGKHHARRIGPFDRGAVLRWTDAESPGELRPEGDEDEDAL